MLLSQGAISPVVALTLEERLNNPGGIEHVRGITWVGQSPDQADPRFVTYLQPEYGIRAIAHTLRTYQRDDGIKTVAAAIERWAPSKVFRNGEWVPENNTEAYIADVCQRCSLAVVSADKDEVNFETIMFDFVKAIIHHENGRVIYSDALIQKAILPTFV